ncbi:uncharacterized protein LOC142743193 [Rhinoderma darwinii]|uniref:uncharacterized protein LOC142743193 n=1 Tax=Rhinoderma darwinii TaxID=43563 RepID=UPI003F66638F
MDLNRFIRKLTLLRHFSLTPNAAILTGPPSDNSPIGVPPPVQVDVRSKSSFYPLHHRGPYLDTFSTLVGNDLKSLEKPNMTNDNLSSCERRAMKSLQNNHQIVIRSADKGGGIVIQDRSVYIKEAYRILSDTTFYEKLVNNTIPSDLIEYNHLIGSAFTKGLLSKKEKQFLSVSFPNTTFLYHLPKIHKSVSSPPGRPIISGIGSLTSNLSHFIDLHLQPFVLELPSFLKDSSQLIRDLNNFNGSYNFSKVSFLTADVSALYLNIPHTLGIEAMSHFLSSEIRIPIEQNNFLLQCIDFILQHNTFMFENKYYRQIKGCAMGSRFAPSYANLFMGMFEENYIWCEHPFRENILLYKRFIDDLFFVWRGDEASATAFIEFLNTNTFGLNFTYTYSGEKIYFLDLTNCKNGDTFTTKTHFKSVDVNSYLDFTSAHYPPWLRNVPFGQFRRIRKNCSNSIDFKKECLILSKRFREKHFPTSLIEGAQLKATKMTQEECVKVAEIDQADHFDYKYNFITTFNAGSKFIRSILGKHWHILCNDPVLKGLLPPLPKVTFRRSRTLKNLLAPSKLHNKGIPSFSALQPPLLGSFRCGQPRCMCCSSITHKMTNFTSTVTSESFDIKSFLTCVSEYVIYLLQCTCKLQYIGRTTQTLRKRINNHRSNVSRGFAKQSVSRHCLYKHNCNFDCISITPIEQIPADYTNRFLCLKQRENYWIYKLCTLHPKGLNDISESSLD